MTWREPKCDRAPEMQEAGLREAIRAESVNRRVEMANREQMRKLLDGHERRSHWATVRQIVEAAQECPGIVQGVPSNLLGDLRNLLSLHERSVRHEYLQGSFAVHGFFKRPKEESESEMMCKMQEVSKQGLLLERCQCRHVFLRKLSEVAEYGEHSEWGRAYAGDEAAALARVKYVLQEVGPHTKG